jgi:hypothetical protein
VANILSSVSGQFSKALILGAFFPTALFVLFAWLFLTPLIPTDWVFFAPLKALDPQWQLAALTILAIILSGILNNLNISIIRLYEGYRWQNTSIGGWFTERQESRRAALQGRYNRLQPLASSLWRSTNQQRDKAALKERNAEYQAACAEHYRLLQQSYNAVLREWNLLGAKLANNYPRIQGVLPTRLGNVLRSSEEYPLYQYGMDGITLWPRLVGVIEEKYFSSLDAARIPLDFMVNSSFLSSLLAGLLLIVGLFNPVLISDWAMWHRYLPWIIQIAVLIVISYFFYLGAVAQASAWGNKFKGAFDLYKSKLLSELGYSHDVSTRAAEYNTWNLISRQMVYGNDEGTNKPRIDYAPAISPPSPPTSVECKNPDCKKYLQITRGIAEVDRVGAITIHVGVKNVHPQDDQPDVVIVDKLPDGFDYEWGTARVEGKRVVVVGINPYKFSIGNVRHGKEVVLVYRMTRREKPLVNVEVGFWRGLLRSLLSLV